MEAIEEETLLKITNVKNTKKLNEILKNFFKGKPKEKNYHIELKEQLINITLNNSNTGFELMKYLNKEKLKNNELKELKCTMEILNKNDSNNKNLNKKINKNEKERNEKIRKREKRSFTMREKLEKIKNIPKLPLANIISVSSPYLTEEERYKLEEKEKSKKNISKEKFVSYFGIATTRKEKGIKNYVNLTPSLPVNQFKFRNEDKTKWVVKNNFKI